MQPIALPGFRRERRARDSKLFAMRDQRASVARLRSIKAALLLGLAMGYPHLRAPCGAQQRLPCAMKLMRARVSNAARSSHDLSKQMLQINACWGGAARKRLAPCHAEHEGGPARAMLCPPKASAAMRARQRRPRSDSSAQAASLGAATRRAASTTHAPQSAALVCRTPRPRVGGWGSASSMAARTLRVGRSPLRAHPAGAFLARALSPARASPWSALTTSAALPGTSGARAVPPA